jgi:hypothetical protein
MSAFAYPINRSSCMTKEGPADHRFQIPGGTLKYNAERDTRFPYLYEITTHALVHMPEFFKTILISQYPSDPMPLWITMVSL